MGKQVRFFMSRKDEIDFLKIIVQLNNFILDNKAYLLTVEEAEVSTDLSFFITSQDLVISKDNNGFVDPIVAEAIQFSRCMVLENKYLRSGRIWAEFKYYDNSKKLKTKSKEFSTMYSVCEKWIKKNFKRSKCKDYYIANDAYSAYKEDRVILVAGPKQAIEFD